MASKKIFSFAGTKCISVLLWVEETALTLLQDCFLGYFCLEQGSHHVLSSAYPSLPKSCHSLLLLAKLMDIMDVLTSFKVSKLSPMWSHGIFRLVEKRNPSPQPGPVSATGKVFAVESNYKLIIHSSEGLPNLLECVCFYQGGCMAKHHTVTNFIKLSQTFSELSMLCALALMSRGAWTQPRSWGRGRGGLLTVTANMLSYYDARHWTEGLKAASLVFLTATLWGKCFWPPVYRWGNWSPERWRNTLRAPRRQTAEPTLLHRTGAWAKWGPDQRATDGGTEVRGQFFLISDPSQEGGKSASWFSPWGQCRRLLASSPAEQMRLSSWLFFTVFVSWKCGWVCLACLAEQQEMHSSGQCQLGFFWSFKRDLARSPIFSPTEKEKCFYVITLLLVKEIWKQ